MEMVKYDCCAYDVYGAGKSFELFQHFYIMNSFILIFQLLKLVIRKLHDPNDDDDETEHGIRMTT